MSDAITLALERSSSGTYARVRVGEPRFAGKRATLVVEHHARVKRSNAIHHTQPLCTHELVLAAGSTDVALGPALERCFEYSGKQLDLELRARITVDDGVLFDTKVAVDLACPLPPRRKAPADAASVHSPRDRFSFVANLRAIPARARLIVIWLIAIGLPVIAVNALVGARDQFVPDSQVWFYDHRAGDGDSESPLLKALGGSGAAGFAIWMAIRRQLQRYMRFTAKLPDAPLAPGLRRRLADLVEGEARVPLQHVTVRLVAYNREHGQYRHKSKNRTETRSFVSDGIGVVLAEQALVHVPAGTPLAGYLSADVDFTPIFTTLYPPLMLGGSHGLSLVLEAQLLHPDYVDQDVVLEPSGIDTGHFY